MNLHFAIINTYQAVRFVDPHDCYGLFSYHFCRISKDLIGYKDRFKGFILDSGVFSYLKGDKVRGERDNQNVDWEKYVDEYANFVIQNKVKNYVEVDVDQMIGYDLVTKLTEKLEKKVGHKCMPVWHMNRGYDNWLKIVHDYDYVCFGAFLTDNLDQSKFPMIKQFLSDAKKSQCNVHGLGLTTDKWLHKLPFYSVDSSTWIAGCRYGYLHYFDKGYIKIQHKKPNQKFIDQERVMMNNINEWRKFAKYCEQKL